MVHLEESTYMLDNALAWLLWTLVIAACLKLFHNTPAHNTYTKTTYVHTVHMVQLIITHHGPPRGAPNRWFAADEKWIPEYFHMEPLYFWVEDPFLGFLLLNPRVLVGGGFSRTNLKI